MLLSLTAELLPYVCGQWSEGAQDDILPVAHSLRARERASLGVLTSEDTGLT